MNAPLPESLERGDIDRIVVSLEQGGCNLLLGTEVDVVATDGTRHNLARDVARHLAEMLRGPGDGRPMGDVVGSDPERGTLPAIAQEFYESRGGEPLSDAVADFLRAEGPAVSPECVFSTLAKLPFRIIVTSRHDHTFDHYLREEGKEPFVRSWDIFAARLSKPLPSDDEITAARPLVFYLCGETENRDSLIVSEDHIIELVRSVTRGSPGVPHYLQMKMRENRSLLVGFGVPKWHTRVILEELGKVLDKNKTSFALGEFGTFVRTGDELGRDRPRTADMEAVRFHLKKFGISTVIGDLPKNLDSILERWREHTAESEEEKPIDANLPYVFISYCGEDDAHAKALYEVLTARGIQCFWDKKDIRAGQAWMSRLAEEIKKITAFVLLVSNNLSQRAIKGSVVYEEAWKARDVARQKNIEQFLIPVFVDDRQEPFNLVTDPDRTFFNLSHARVLEDTDRQALADAILEAHEARMTGVRR